MRRQSWALMLREQSTSGLSIKDWCEQNNLSTKAFYYRRRQVQSMILDSAEESRFTELVMPEPYDYTGHLFESRYTSCLIEDERYFLEVSRYIHLNPVKAMMVREPQAYSYSSRDQYRMFVEGKISHAEQEMLIQKDMGEDEMWLPW